jgi:hypothetical protein
MYIRCSEAEVWNWPAPPVLTVNDTEQMSVTAADLQVRAVHNARVHAAVYAKHKRPNPVGSWRNT